RGRFLLLPGEFWRGLRGIAQFLSGSTAAGRALHLLQFRLLKLFLQTRASFGTRAEFGDFYHLFVQLLAQGEFACVGGDARLIQRVFNLRFHVGAAPKIPEKETDKASCQRDRTDKCRSTAHVYASPIANLS